MPGLKTIDPGSGNVQKDGLLPKGKQPWQTLERKGHKTLFETRFGLELEKIQQSLGKKHGVKKDAKGQSTDRQGFAEISPGE